MSMYNINSTATSTYTTYSDSFHYPFLKSIKFGDLDVIAKKVGMKTRGSIEADIEEESETSEPEKIFKFDLENLVL